MDGRHKATKLGSLFDNSKQMNRTTYLCRPNFYLIFMTNEGSPQPLDADFSRQQLEDGLQITDQLRRYWTEIGSWALFLGISAIALAGLFSFAIFDATSSEFGVDPGTTLALVCFITLLGAIGFFFWRTAFGLRSGVEREDADQLELGFRNLYAVMLTHAMLAILYLISLLVVLVGLVILFNKLKGLSPQDF
jgi:hypothetical protein